LAACAYEKVEEAAISLDLVSAAEIMLMLTTKKKTATTRNGCQSRLVIYGKMPMPTLPSRGEARNVRSKSV
jgi:hypothetical protein